MPLISRCALETPRWFCVPPPSSSAASATDAFDGVYVGERVGDRIEYRGRVEWGYRAPDVLRIMQAAQEHPLRSSPFTNAPRMKNAV